jgi:hypothetical protein
MASQKEKDAKEPSKFRKRLREAGMILVVAIIVSVAVDGYFNRWDAILSLLHWHTLALQSEDGEEWRLSSGDRITVVRINDSARLFHLDSLRTFDRPYNTAGFYRLYFRRSDSLSSTVSALYRKFSEYDKGHKVDRTIFAGRQAFRSALRFFGQDTTKDTAVYVPPVPVPSERPSDAPSLGIMSDSIRLGTLWSGTASDITEAATKLVGRSPTAVIGIGLGVVAAAGLDLLKGDVYLAYANTDVFRLRTLTVGPRAGTWEGKDIDILWLFAPGELERSQRDTTRPAP